VDDAVVEVDMVGMADELEEKDVLAAVEDADDVLTTVEELEKLDELEVIAITELEELEALELIEELEAIETAEELETTLELVEIDKDVDDDEATVELLAVDEVELPPRAYNWILFPAPQYEYLSPGQRKLQSAWLGTSLLSGIRVLPQ
jgi:hypothetical protein